VSRDLIGYGNSPPRVAWPNGARLAVSVLVHFEEGAERSPLDGDVNSEAADPESATEGAVSEGPRRDLQVESLWEYGSRRGVWRILETLERNGVVATFLCAGRSLERNPEAARAIRERGHEICAHGYRYIAYHAVSEQEERADISNAIATIKRVTGSMPSGWYSRAPSVRTRGLLLELGDFRYDCDSNSDELPYLVRVGEKRILTIPYPADTNDERFWAMTGVSGFTAPADFHDLLRASFDRAYEEAKDRTRLMSLAVRLRITGRPSRALHLDRFLEYAAHCEDVWFARRNDVAEWWLRHAGVE
jgi:peptidoglycan/xylan/chitin deacetylase (PgdA/CDA1 family)